MAHLLIEGGHPLSGTLRPSGNKNAAMPMMCAAVLTDQPVTLRNVPRIGDVHLLLKLLQELGVEVQWVNRHVLCLQARNLTGPEPNAQLFRSLRGSLTLMGPLLARMGEFQVGAQAGGDDIGRRRIDTHLQVFRAFGVEIRDQKPGQFHLQMDRALTGADIWLDEASVTATENGVMMAAAAKGTTIIHNAACEPHVEDLCRLLMAMGCTIEGLGTNRLVILGSADLGGADCTIGPDYMEIGSYLGLGAITTGRLCITDVLPAQLRLIEMEFRQRLGVRMAYEDCQPDGRATLVLDQEQDLVVRPDFGGAIPRICSAPWPGFPSDLISIALVTATQARGTIIINEKMFESRLYFVDKLVSMGAQVIFCDPHRVVTAGPSTLYGNRVSSPDIRAGMALILAALCARGTTHIAQIEQVERGYSNIVPNLTRLGAAVELVSSDENLGVPGMPGTAFMPRAEETPEQALPERPD